MWMKYCKKEDSYTCLIKMGFLGVEEYVAKQGKQILWWEPKGGTMLRPLHLYHTNVQTCHPLIHDKIFLKEDD